MNKLFQNLKQKTNNMENYLIELLKQPIDLEDFYVINIYENDCYGEHIHLQGHNSPEIFLKYSKLGYEFKADDKKDNEWFRAQKGIISITLTNKK